MFLVRRPSATQIGRFLEQQRRSDYSYPQLGATSGGPAALPGGYNHDHTRIQLGVGEQCFLRGVAALRAWAMFDLGWTRVCDPQPPIELGATVIVQVRHAGIYWLIASRIVYLLDEPGPLRRWGFAYGTLRGHAERGEERFLIEWREDDSVWYELLAFSWPAHPLARLGYPFTRLLQKRFARDSMRVMREMLSFDSPQRHRDTAL